MDVLKKLEQIVAEMEKKTKTQYIETFNQQKSNPIKSDREKPLKNKIFDVSREVAEFSLLPGLSNIVRNELPIKISWALFQLTLLGKNERHAQHLIQYIFMIP